MPKKPTLITSTHPKGRQFIRLCEAVYDKAGLDAKQAQLVNEHGGELQAAVLMAIRDLSVDMRERQAKRYWNLGVGRELGLVTFDQYLATIPRVPANLAKDDAAFPLIVLVEPRIGLAKLCRIGNVSFSDDDNTFDIFDARHAEFAKPTWIRMQNGRKNRNRSVSDCRDSFAKKELGLTVFQGVCAYLQHPDAVPEATEDGAHVMDLPGSVHREDRGGAAYLGVWYGQPELGCDLDGGAHPGCGSASRREC